MIRVFLITVVAIGFFLSTHNASLGQAPTENTAKPKTIGKIEVIEQSFKDLIDPNAEIDAVHDCRQVFVARKDQDEGFVVCRP